jgi:hypothetical protein
MKMSNRKLVAELILLLLFFAGIAAGTTYYVDPCGTDEDGLSWESAFLSIRQGIDEANDGDIVMVGPGTYIGGLNFSGKAITLTGTDPNDWDVVKSTIIDCNGSLAEPNDILFVNSEDANSILTGVTVTGGYGTLYNTYNYGGAVQCRGSSPTILNCIFHGNTNDTEGYSAFGGAIAAIEGANPLIESCIMYDNDCIYGGGVCIMDANAVIRNCLIYDHKTAWGGGGIGNWGGTDVEITNCTIVNNVSYDLHHLSFGGGIDSVFSSANQTITNCIVWGNSIEDLLGCSAEYSCIEDDDEGEGTIHDDPMFIDPASGNFNLSCFSPCINAGSEDPQVQTGNFDVDGKSRVVYGRVDIGAYEIFPAAFDLDPDGKVDFFDFAVFAEHWLEGVE